MPMQSHQIHTHIKVMSMKEVFDEERKENNQIKRERKTHIKLNQVIHINAHEAYHIATIKQ